MHDLRPIVQEQDILRVLGEHFDQPIRNLEPVEGGQVARTYAFSAGDDLYILRVNRQLGANVGKEVFLDRLLAGSGIPYPAPLHHGRLGELFYSVIPRMPGVPVSDLAREDAMRLAPALLDMLDTIQAVDVTGTTGFATAGDDGNGLFPGWRQWLASIRDEEPDWDYYGRWHVLFETTFLERDVFDVVYARMEALLPHCPEERCLYHGNFGFSNVLTHDGRITAVLDWQEAGYGDRLSDLAHLDFWDPEARWVDLVRGRLPDDVTDTMEARIRCYQLHLGLDAMRFFAKKQDEGAYRWTVSRLQALIGNPIPADEDHGARP